MEAQGIKVVDLSHEVRELKGIVAVQQEALEDAARVFEGLSQEDERFSKIASSLGWLLRHSQLIK
jgi:hypothetical protein